MALQVYGKLWLNFGSYSGRLRTAAQVASRICSTLARHGISAESCEGSFRIQVSISPHDQAIFNAAVDEVQALSL